MNLVKNSLTEYNLQPGASRGLPGGSGISRESAGFHLLSGPWLFPVGVSGEEFVPAGGGGDHPSSLPDWAHQAFGSCYSGCAQGVFV